MRLCVLTFLALLLAITAQAERLHKEAHYQQLFAKAMNGQAEVLMPDKTRCDVLTEAYAIEVDFAEKWSEAVGQSLYYAIQTNKQAGIVLIMEKTTDQRYLLRLGTIIQHNKLPITVWLIDSEGKITQALPVATPPANPVP